MTTTISRLIVRCGHRSLTIRAEGSIRGEGLRFVQAGFKAAMSAHPASVTAMEPTVKSPRRKAHEVEAQIHCQTTAELDSRATSAVIAMRAIGAWIDVVGVGERSRQWAATMREETPR